MHALLIPSDGRGLVRKVFLPPVQSLARRKIGRLAARPLTVVYGGIETPEPVSVVGEKVGTDKGAYLMLYSRGSAHGAARNTRAELLAEQPVHGNAVVVSLVQVRYEEPLLMSVSADTRALIFSVLSGFRETGLTDSHAVL